jgi:hypothetical protein
MLQRAKDEIRNLIRDRKSGCGYMEKNINENNP